MKRSLIIVACTSFCFIFSAEHDDQRLLQQLSEHERQSVQQFLEQRPDSDVVRRLLEQRLLRLELLQPTFERQPIVGIAVVELNSASKNKEELHLLQKQRAREAMLNKGIELDNVSGIICSISRGGRKIVFVEISEIEEGPMMSVRRITGEEISFKEHTRRSDKYKKTAFVQYPQAHQRTNNRVDRPTLVQANKKSNTRNY